MIRGRGGGYGCWLSGMSGACNGGRVVVVVVVLGVVTTKTMVVVVVLVVLGGSSTVPPVTSGCRMRAESISSCFLGLQQSALNHAVGGLERRRPSVASPKHLH